MGIDERDRHWMGRALSLATGAVGLSEPNPRVGCVILSARGDVLGEGHTQEAGGPHAEVVALKAAEAAGQPTEGGVAYVTLEPCAHHGRTPPCADALVRAGVARAVVALLDPNPLVGGQGIARLQAAGIRVDVLPIADPMAIQARDLNIGFLSRMARKRPWVRVKVAASLDGRTALVDGQSRWITSAAAREDGHHWRARAGAVMTGMGTIRDDDPRLDVRGVRVHRQPLRVVLDPRWTLPLEAAVLGANPCEVLVFGLDNVAQGRRQALVDKGVGVAALEPAAEGLEGAGRLNLQAVLAELARRGVNELHVEAGATLTGAMIGQGWADELLLYMAPKVLGPGRPVADMPSLLSLKDAQQFVWTDVARVGDDLRLIARRPGAATF